MDTIKATVTIPEDHRLRMELEVPPTVPAGEADVLLIISAKRRGRRQRSLASLAGSLAKSPHFSGDPVAIQRKLRGEWDRSRS